MSEKGKKWDGKSRPSTNIYKKNFDDIFGKKKKENKKENGQSR